MNGLKLISIVMCCLGMILIFSSCSDEENIIDKSMTVKIRFPGSYFSRGSYVLMDQTVIGTVLDSNKGPIHRGYQIVDVKIEYPYINHVFKESCIKAAIVNNVHVIDMKYLYQGSPIESNVVLKGQGVIKTTMDEICKARKFALRHLQPYMDEAHTWLPDDKSIKNAWSSFGAYLRLLKEKGSLTDLQKEDLLESCKNLLKALDRYPSKKSDRKFKGKLYKLMDILSGNEQVGSEDGSVQ